ncbi:septum formation initiator family protein [Williamsia maris]|uniref:Cell division protein DivIC n=1 Tax=Williamsia maris TaxID=72806 RepID=A0ABT1H8I3_9NOCA|nr:septum formation initiator family protein [Williamsia maris]MCP2174489.1 cell division protein DivIC [Williamsia maris]
MAQRKKPDGRTRRTARPTSGRRVEGRREQRRDLRRTDNGRDARTSADRAEVASGSGVVDSAPATGRVRGLSPKRAVVLALVLSVVALTLAVPLRTYFSQRSEADQLRSTNSSLRQEVSDYQAKVDEQSDPANIAALARDRLQFVMPGDKALVMQFPTAPEKSDEQKRAERRAGDPWYSQLLESVSTPAEK